MRGICFWLAPATWGRLNAGSRIAESECGVWWWQRSSGSRDISRSNLGIPREQRTDDGGEMKGREGQLQVAKGGASTETDLGVALIGFACSTRSQAARRSTRAIPRFQVASGAINGKFTAVWCFYCSLWPFLPISPPRSWVVEEKMLRNVMRVRSISIKRDLEVATKHIEVAGQSQSTNHTPPSARPRACLRS